MFARQKGALCAPPVAGPPLAALSATVRVPAQGAQRRNKARRAFLGAGKTRPGHDDAPRQAIASIARIRAAHRRGG